MVTRLNEDFNLNSWSFTISGTPQSVLDSATIPSVNFSRDILAEETKPDWLFETDGEFFLEEYINPFYGKYANLVTDGDTLDGSLVHRIDALNVTRTLYPRSGDLETVMTGALEDAGVDASGIIVAGSGTYHMAGGHGNYWSLINQFLAANGLAMLLDPVIIVAPARGAPELTLDNLTAKITKNISRGNPARNITTSTFNHEPVVQGEVYPDDVMSAAVIQAEAGEIVETEIQLTGWLSQINQPVCVDFVKADPGYYDNTDGVYSVAGSDGLPVTPAQWAGTGGWLKVELTDKPDVAKVTIRGADREDLAPYRLAMTSGNFYSSLRITGTGVRYREQEITFPTGVDPALTTEEVGQNISDPMLGNMGMALHQAALVADRFGGLDMSLTVQSDSKEILAYRIIVHDDAKWIGTDVTVGPDGQSATFIPTTNLGDMEDLYSGRSLGSVQDLWVGKRLEHMQIRPLWSGN